MTRRISDALWHSIIGGGVLIIIALLQIWQATITIRAAHDAKTAASSASVAVAEVADKAEALSVVINDTHTLVNSNMGVQLRLGMELAEWKAAQTNDPQHIADAKLARAMYEEHVKKQEEVDRKGDAP
jgi:hypothetical protein